MTEETDVPQDGTDAIVVHETLDNAPAEEAAETIAPKSDDSTDQQTEAEETGQADETGEPPVKKKPWWEKRFDELAADKHAERRRAEAAEARLQALEQQYWPPAPATPPDQWDDPEGHTRWLIEQAKREALEEIKQTQRLSTYGEKVAKFAEGHPDYAELVANNPDLTITPNMANVIFESDLGPQVAYHLGQNPAEARRIAALPDYRQAAELGKLEAKLSQPAVPPPARTPPPPPPATVAGLSAGLQKGPEEMSMAEYIKAREAGQIT